MNRIDFIYTKHKLGTDFRWDNNNNMLVILYTKLVCLVAQCLTSAELNCDR